MHSVPFAISSDYDALKGIDEGVSLKDMVYAKGVARFAEDVLTLEYQTVNSFTGKKKAEIHAVRLPLDDLEAVDFKRRVVGTSMKVRTRTFKALSDIPGSRHGEVTLRFSRRHRDSAHDLAYHVALRISERKLELLDEELNRLNPTDDLDDL